MAVQKCNYYSEPDHAVKHCPYLRAAMSMEAGVNRATELRLLSTLTRKRKRKLSCYYTFVILVT